MSTPKHSLRGPRTRVLRGANTYPDLLEEVYRPPESLYVIGDVNALTTGLAVIGARKATPYGLSCAKRFAAIAAQKGVPIISGGARGCDSAAHRAALSVQGPTVAFLGGGCDRPYPASNIPLFQQIVDSGGAIVSEHPWEQEPLPYMFRERNRLIAGLASAVLIVEAGLPSGTFSTADDALNAGKEVLVVPGAITSASSHGSNRLLYQGAIPVIDDETFEDALFTVMGLLKQDTETTKKPESNPVLAAVLAAPTDAEQLFQLAVEHYGDNARAELSKLLTEAEASGRIARNRDGRWGPVVSPI